jgi:hypothetical protein
MRIKGEYDVGKGEEIAVGLVVLVRVLQDYYFWVVTPHCFRGTPSGQRIEAIGSPETSASNTKQYGALFQKTAVLTSSQESQISD